MKRTSKPPTRRSIAQQLDSQAPPDWEKPAWVDKALDRKVTTGPRKHPEQDLQILLVEYLNGLPGTMVWSSANHIYIGPMTGPKMSYMAREKKAGLLKGASDLNVFFRNIHGASTLVLPETKVGGNKADEDQQAFIDEANSIGAFSGVVKSLDDLINLLRLAGHPGVQ